MAQNYTVRQTAGVRTAQIDAGLRAHMNKVYGLMAVAMLITAGAAWAIAGLATTTDPAAAAAQMNNGKYLTDLGYAIFASPLKWVIVFAPLAMVFLFGAALNRLSTQAATLVFYVFAALIGLSLSSIFLVYTSASIVQTFLVTAIAFAGLSLYGYTTNKDLSGMGRFLVMGLIGIIAASIINLFLQSSGLQFAVSIIGVVIFSALTAYDTQSIKNDYLEVRTQPGGEAIAEKMAINGALRLYLDFINLFTFLLQFLGNRE